MGRKSKIKNESQKEVKIYFSDYASSILLQWREKLNVNEKTANELIDIAKKVIKENLYCKECRNVMLNEFFYRQMSQPANKHRSQLCKICHKREYPN